SGDVYDLIIAVALATSARSIEIFKISEFVAFPDDPHKILIQGLAKINTEVNGASVTRNLVGLRSDQVIDAVQHIRANVNLSGDHHAITNRANPNINARYKLAFPKFGTSHKTRYISGNVSYKLYGQPYKIPYETYLRLQYGHINPKSTRTYQGINLQWKDKKNKKIYIDRIKNKDQIPIYESEEDIELPEPVCSNSLLSNRLNTIDLNKSEGINLNDSKKVNQSDMKSYSPPNEKNDEYAGDSFSVSITQNPYEDVDLDQFASSHANRKRNQEKIDKIIRAIQELQKKNISINQADLRERLGYSNAIMTKAYKVARETGVIQ